MTFMPDMTIYASLHCCPQWAVSDRYSQFKPGFL